MLKDIFAENSVATRKNFFLTRMIQFIWKNHFLKEADQFILEHLRRTRGLKYGHQKVSRFIEEI